MNKPEPKDIEPAQSVKKALEQVAAHPALIQFQVSDGTVTLSGTALARELSSLIEAVRRVPGIRSVEQRFDVIFPARGTSPPNRSENRFGYLPGFIEGEWPAWLRAAGGASGLALLIQGLRKKEALGLFSAAAGILLCARAATNRNVPHLIGSVVLPVMSMSRTLRLAAPLEEVYEFWARFANYPRFMSFIRDVHVNDSGGLRWTARAPGGLELRWDTTVLDLSPGRKIAWKSVPGSLIATEGEIRFERTETDSCELQVELSYAPPAGALGYAIARLLGFDPRERIDEDLEVMRLLVESPAIPGARPESGATG